MVGVHHMAHIYKSSKPLDIENSLCFQVIGFDVMIDQYLKCWLIEVNQSPSFLTDSPLDYQIKKNVLRDSLHMLNLNNKKKNRYLREMR